MNGRTVFKAFKPIFSLIIFILSFLPQRVNLFLLDFSSLIPSKIGVGLRYIFLKSACPNIGLNVYLGRFLTVKNVQNFSIGDNVSIHDYTYIDAVGGVDIGSDVSIAHGTSIISFEHNYDATDTPIKYSGLHLGPVKIDNDVWIGCGVRILSNSHIKNKTVIAAGSVVKGKLESSSIYAGVPVRKVKDIK